jgi:ABC-type branched-subunit amino acid transport system ATPase component
MTILWLAFGLITASYFMTAYRAHRWQKLFEETLAKLEMSVALKEALLLELDEPVAGVFDQEMSMN